MSENILNTLYAPGIATYGAKGEKGERGRDGYSIYYIPIDIDQNNKNDIINNFISKNRYISNNYVNNLQLNNRSYQYGDIFITPNNTVYQYYNLNGIVDLYDIGKLNDENNALFSIETDNNDNKFVYLKKDNMVIGNTSVGGDIALLNLISKDNKKYISFYNNDNNEVLSIIPKKISDNNETDTTKDVTLITGNSKLCIDNLYLNDITSNSDTSINIDGKKYYKPLLQKDFNIDVSIDNNQHIIITRDDNSSYLCNIYTINNDNQLSNNIYKFNNKNIVIIVPDDHDIQNNDTTDIIKIAGDIIMITISSLDSYISKIIYLKK